MKAQLAEKGKNLYLTILLAHFLSKTSDQTFHQFTEKLYEGIGFSCFHDISERIQDEKEDGKQDMGALAQEVYDALEEFKIELEDIIDSGTESIATDDLLRSLVSQLTDACGSARSFLSKPENDDQ